MRKSFGRRDGKVAVKRDCRGVALAVGTGSAGRLEVCFVEIEKIKHINVDAGWVYYTPNYKIQKTSVEVGLGANML